MYPSLVCVCLCGSVCPSCSNQLKPPTLPLLSIHFFNRPSRNSARHLPDEYLTRYCCLMLSFDRCSQGKAPFHMRYKSPWGKHCYYLITNVLWWRQKRTYHRNISGKKPYCQIHARGYYVSLVRKVTRNTFLVYFMSIVGVVKVNKYIFLLLIILLLKKQKQIPLPHRCSHDRKIISSLLYQAPQHPCSRARYTSLLPSPVPYLPLTAVASSILLIFVRHSCVSLPSPPHIPSPVPIWYPLSFRSLFLSPHSCPLLLTVSLFSSVHPFKPIHPRPTLSRLGSASPVIPHTVSCIAL